MHYLDFVMDAGNGDILGMCFEEGLCSVCGWKEGKKFLKTRSKTLSAHQYLCILLHFPDSLPCIWICPLTCSGKWKVNRNAGSLTV